MRLQIRLVFRSRHCSPILQSFQTFQHQRGLSPRQTGCTCNYRRDIGAVRKSARRCSKCRPFKGHTDEIDALAFSADNTRLASAGRDRTIRVWDCDNSKFVRAWDAGCAVGVLAFSTDGKLLISAGDDQLVRVWQVEDGKLLHTLKGHTGSVVSLLRVRRQDRVRRTRPNHPRLGFGDRHGSRPHRRAA